MKSDRIKSSLKWSTLSEFSSRLLTPIISLILARIISPNEFGIIATILMILSLIELITDAGFQKYIIHKQFEDNIIRNNYLNTAFWTNISLTLLIIITLFLNKDLFSGIMDIENSNNILIIISLHILLVSLNSLQIGLLKKEFKFKLLFKIRLIGSLVPLFVTLPLALLHFSFWSILIGNLVMVLITTVMSYIYSEWKPVFSYNLKFLSNMLSFSIWSVLESILIWSVIWGDIFVINYFYDKYSVGIYKTPTNMITSLLGIVSAAIIPVMFSIFSINQNDNNVLIKYYLTTQRYLSLVLLPVSAIVFIFSDQLTYYLFGSQWTQSSDIVGLWTVITSILIVTSQLNSELYRAKGLSNIAMFSQLIHLIFLIPVFLSAKYLIFEHFIILRIFSRLQLTIVHAFLLKRIFNLNIWSQLKNLMSYILIFIFSILILFMVDKLWGSYVNFMVSIVFYIIVYSVVIIFVHSTKKDVLYLIKILRK